MALPDLPVEVLTQIMENTLPDGCESLSMTCKSVYIKGESVRRKHNELKRRYQNFSYDIIEDGTEEPAVEDQHGVYDPDKCFSSLHLLLRIAEEPLIAEYMVSAHLQHDTIPWYGSEAVATEAKASRNLLNLLGRSAYFNQIGLHPQDNKVLDIIRPQLITDSRLVLDHLVTTYIFGDCVGTSCIATTFLLSLLQNVTILALPSNWDTYGWGDSNPEFWDRGPALQDLVTRANDPNDPTAGLSKLTYIVPSLAWGYDKRWPLEYFNPFLSIKTVTSFIAGGCVAVDDNYTGYPFPDPEYESYGINIEEVTLAGSVFEAKEFEKFLRRLPKLKHLKFSYETKYHGCGSDMEANGILAAIESTTKNTLESLTFTILSCNYSGIIGPFKDFTRLREVELDTEVLVGENDSAETNVHSLGDLIPASLERFVLRVNIHKAYTPMLDRLFEGVAASVQEKLPNLKEVVLEFGGRGNPDLEWLKVVEDCEASEAAGSSVDLWKRELVALGKLVDVRTGQSFSRGYPSFMVGFAEKYDVEPEY